MIVKTLLFYAGKEETESSRGACVTFSANRVKETSAGVWMLQNEAGQVVGILTVGHGAHFREVVP